jgi:hypothetical protein
MHTLTIQNHNKNTTYNKPHFFILSKGYNAGRPSATPYANGLVLLASDEIEKGMLFWICFSLWKTNGFGPLLRGTGVPVLNSTDATELIDKTCLKLSVDPDLFVSNVKELKELIQTENLLSVQLKMIKHIKKAVALKLLR